MYHDIGVDEALERAESSRNGLTKEESEKRLKRDGLNEFDAVKKKNLFQKFIAQFKDVMILVLIAAAIVSAVIAIVRKEAGSRCCCSR